MTDNNHPITPPPGLVEQLRKEAPLAGVGRERHLIAAAYRAGADYELDAILALAKNQGRLGSSASDSDEDCYFDGFTVAGIRRKRRPVPPSSAEEALQAIAAIEASDGDYRQFEQDIDTIRRALERLQELEGRGDD